MTDPIRDLGWLRREARELLRPAERAVPLLGAGTSRAADLPGGAQIAAELLSLGTERGADFSTVAPADRENCKVIADTWAARDPRVEAEIRAVVCGSIENASASMRLTPTLRALVHIPSRLCLTLNYDLSVEEAAKAEAIDHRSIVARNLDAATLREIGERRHPLLIVHLHGSVSDRESLVLTAGDYAQLNSSSYLGDLFSLVLYQWNVCFMGMSFEETYLPSIFSLRALSVPKHVYVGPESRVLELASGSGAIRPVEHGIIGVGFPDGVWAAVDDFAEWLVAEEPPPVAEHELDPGSGPDPGYVPQRLIARSQEQSGSELAAEIALGLIDTVSEPEFAGESRAVIEGAPGTGKTSLLRRIGTLVPDDELPILINLRNLEASAGIPEEILSGWASKGEVLREEPAPLGPEVFASRRFCFLFDGLDEVQAERRGDLAAVVREISERLPQHRYFLAARPVEELENFSEPPWRALRLQPGAEWRQRFLEDRGIDPKDLFGSVEGLAANSSLLSVPFFLRTVVELRDKGQLEEITDLRELAINLVQARVTEDPVLSVSAKELLPWLGAVALALTLAGRTSASIEELRRFGIELPSAVGSLDGLVDQLVARALLSLSGGNYAFQHRLMQEALAADQIEALGPRPGLLDAIVPRASETVTGTRLEWSVPLGMVMWRHIEWRQAIRDRDSLLVARAVPAEADEEERRWAAQTLWATYLKTRLWMHDWRDPASVQDSEVLGRLLEDPALAEIREQVIAGLDVPQRQIAANAIEVLGFTEWRGLLAATRRLLVNPDTDFVVARHAASVARRRNFVSLFEAIKRRALIATESTEVSDLSSVAAALAPSSELLELALELSRKGEETISPRHERRLSPAERIRYMRFLATNEREAFSTTKEEAVALITEIKRAERKTAEDVGWIAACWSLEDQTLLDWIAVRPASAVGVIDALDAGRAYTYQAVPLLSRFSTRVLGEAGAGEELIEQIEQMKALRREATLATHNVFDYDSDEAEYLPSEPEPTLLSLLDQPAAGSDAVLQRNARYFAAAATELAERDRRRLRRRLGSWWRDGELQGAIRKVRRGSYRIAGWAAAWLAYGPAINATLRPRQWAELAVYGTNLSEQHEWLARQHSPAGERIAAGLSQSSLVSTWSDLLSSIPGAPSRALVEAITTHARRVDDSYKLGLIGSRLAEAGELDSLRRLAAIGSGFAEGLLPNLAAAGDFDAQRTLLRRLRHSLSSGQAERYTETLSWLDAVRDKRLVGELIHCLRLAQPLEGDVHPDVIGPLRAAMQAVGGQVAIDAYDSLVLEDVKGIQFLRYAREAIAQEMLSEAGMAAAAELSAEIELPLL